MPKVVMGGKPQNREDGQVSISEVLAGKAPQVIDDKSNRQGAAEARAKAPEKPAAEAPAPEVAKPDVAAAPGDDPGDGLEPEDNDLAERAKKRIAKKHRELKQTEALVDKLKGELQDGEEFSKAQYNRARLAEEKLAELERELTSLKQAQPAVEKKAGQEPAKEPDPKDFYDEKGNFKLAEYTKAVGKFEADKAVGDFKANQESERRKAEAETQQKAAEQARQLAVERLEVAKKKYSDWDKVVTAKPGLGLEPSPTGDAVSSYILMSEHMGDFSHYIASNPDFAARLNKLHPMQAIAELGRLEIRWQSKPEAVKTEAPARDNGSAPAPITPLPGSGSAGVTKQPEKMTVAELRQYERERAAAKRRR